MIHIITAENRQLYFNELREMHQQRKRVFVDELGWPLDCAEGLEIDEYDSAHIIYLLYFDDDALLGSIRMLPTDRPHLMGDVFAGLCPNGVPQGPAIWEATRFCPAPTLDAQQKRWMLGALIGGMIECALLFGIEHITFVAGGALKPLALKAGWSARALGPPVRREGDRLTACIADADPASLRRVRANFSLPNPLTRYAIRKAA